MARQKKQSPQVEEARPYIEGVAKNLVDKLYGPTGPAWGTTLTEIEDLLLGIRQVLTEKMLDESLARQAAAADQQAAATRLCPGCQQPLACDAANPRLVQTRAGEAEWSEPEGYCPRCRRAFFPSVPESRDRSG
jgi:hypothetical protein